MLNRGREVREQQEDKTMKKLMCAALVVMAFFATTTYAWAHGIGAEGDDNNNRTLTWCAAGSLPDYIETDFAQGVGGTSGWNRFRATYGTEFPRYAKVTVQTYPECEVRLVPKSAVAAGDALYTWRNDAQDTIQFDTPALANRTNKWKQYVGTHEAGHGHGSPHEQSVGCSTSVMRVTCKQSAVIGFPSSGFDGPHMRDLWVGADAPYPNGGGFGTDDEETIVLAPPEPE
jgi:hypothetical protein